MSENSKQHFSLVLPCSLRMLMQNFGSVFGCYTDGSSVDDFQQHRS